MRRLSSLMTLILVASVLLIGGVSAAWVYSTGDPTGDSTDANIGMGEWDFGYIISFINNGADLADPITVLDNTTEYKLTNSSTATGVDNVVDAVKAAANAAQAWAQANEGENVSFSHWINAGSTRVDSIPAGNVEDVTLYPSFINLYTAMFVDQDGSMFVFEDGTEAWTNYTTSTKEAVIEMGEKLAEELIAKTQDSEMQFEKWQIIEVDNKGTDDTSDDVITLKDLTAANLTKDVTISPIYRYSGSAALTPVDSDGDGKTNYYQVSGFGQDSDGLDLVEIPSEVNGIPVTGIVSGAFSSYDDLHSVRIPATITEMGDSIFPGNWFSQEEITIYFEGTDDQWRTLMETSEDWGSGMGSGTRVFFVKKVLNSDGEIEYKVDEEKGYYQLSRNWRGQHTWNYTAEISSDIKSTYSGNCTCSSCGGGPRPDQKYWN